MFIDHMNIMKKLLLLLVFPIAGLIIFSLIGLYGKYDSLSSLDDVKDIVQMSVAIKDFVNESQRERGLTGVFIASWGDAFQKEVEEARRAADEKRAALEKYLNDAGNVRFGSDFMNRLAEAKDLISQIEKKRSDINALHLSAAEAVDFYSVMHGHLFDVIKELALMSTDVEIGNQIEAFRNLQELKEEVGLERAVLSQAFQLGRLEPGAATILHVHIALQDLFMGQFQISASAKAREHLAEALRQPCVTDTARMRQIALDREKTGDFGIDPAYWFKQMTCKTNLLREETNYMVGNLLALLSHRMVSAQISLAVYSLVTMLLILVSVWLSYVVVHRITRQTNDLTATMQAFSQGDLERRFEARMRDEIGQLGMAFNSMAVKIKESTVREREAAEQIRMLVNTIVDGIIVIDSRGRIQTFNPAAVTLFGYTQDEVEGKNIKMLMPEPYSQEHDGYLHNYLTTGDKKIIGIGREVTGKRKDDSTFPMDLAVSEMEVNGERMFTGMVRDITERKQAEEQLHQALEELERSNQELQQFAYVASHDLQEPLRMVVSFLGLIESEYADKLDDNGKEYIQFAVDGGKRMKALIQGLLEYSRVQSQGKAFAMSDTQTALADALANLKFAIEDSGAEIINEPLPVVYADPGQLIRLFQNLIGNAIKFRGNQSPRIHISCQPAAQADKLPEGVAANDWLFIVQDNGIGFESGEGERIFKMFQRLNAQSAYPGTGIGLSVCQRIVQRHGGNIWATSELGRGSRFYFTLPNHKT